MRDPQEEDPTRVPVQAAAWARAERRWARGEGLPWLHQEIARRMAERLPIIRAEPQLILEWDADAGQSGPALRAAYPHGQWIPVRQTAASKPMAETGLTPAISSRLMARLSTWRQRLLGSVPPEPPRHTGLTEAAVPDGQAQLVWSNLGLHRRADPGRVLQRWHAALAVDGFLMFSTFGPDTLKELRGIWAAEGWGPPAQPFRDMHDWGDDLVAAGFADPVMDQETLTLTWSSPESALAELRTLGLNAHPDRYPGCRTPRWRARLQNVLQDLAGPDGRIGLSFELVYGHAFRPVPRPRVAPLTAVSLDDMRTLVQSARKPL